jgi:hypothetical protein
MMRATAGRVATLRKVSEMGGVEVDDLLAAIRDEVERKADGKPEVPDGAPKPDGGPGKSAPDKVAELKSLILDLHDGIAHGGTAHPGGNAGRGDPAPL